MAALQAPYIITPAFNEIEVIVQQVSDELQFAGAGASPNTSVTLSRVPTNIALDNGLSVSARRFDGRKLVQSLLVDKKTLINTWAYEDYFLKAQYTNSGDSVLRWALNAVHQIGESLDLYMSGATPLLTNLRNRNRQSMYAGFPAGMTVMAKGWYTPSKEQGGPSYWVDSAGQRHIFTYANTPPDNFTGNDDNVIIENTTVNKADILHITFGDDYKTQTWQLGAYFCADLVNLRSVNLWGLSGQVSLPIGFFSNCPSLLTLDLSMFGGLEGGSGLDYGCFNGCSSLWRIDVGSVDWTIIPVQSPSSAFQGAPNNVQYSKIYSSDVVIADEFKQYFPNLSGYQTLAGSMPDAAIIIKKGNEYFSVSVDGATLFGETAVPVHAHIEFTGSESPVEVVVQGISVDFTPACAPEYPVYLRWVNKDGGYDYYMFERRNWFSKTISDIESYDVFEPDTQSARGATRVVQAARTEEVRVGAANIQREEWDWVTNILFSCRIEYWDNILGIWKRVNILDDTSAEWDSDAVVNTFELTITLPHKNIQL